MSFDARFSSSPYPGLRPFEPEESDIFFGREKQTDELLARLQKHHFVAVVGPSGCGKSSLVCAGMIPAMKTGFICDAGPDWRILQMRPGERPMGHLAAAILASRNGEPEIDAGARLVAEAALRRGPLGLVELARETNLCADANLLVLVDQFEELFRFRERVDPDDADAFVALLLATAAQKELPIYIVITMRSDFLGDCAIFHGLPEAINASQYLTPRLTREQCSEAICGPARVFGGDVDEKLLNRLLNDFGPDPDQLPVLQHALMRMWQRHPASTTAGGSPSRIVLTLDDYESKEIGGLRDALSRHGEEVMGELTAEQKRIAQFLFRRLTERGKGRRDTRSPARVEEVAAIAGVSIGEIEPVVEAFRRADRSFLMPRAGEPLQPHTFLDIGHESLIRQWDTLAKWMDEEAESAEVYIRLKETARLWKAGNAGLWGTPDLESALKWRHKIQPEPADPRSLEAWASRYGSTEDLRLAQEFLTASQEKFRRQKEESEEANRRKIRRARLAAAGFAAAIVVIASVPVYFYLFRWDYEAFYNSYVKVRGAPKGIGELSSEQVQRRPVSLKIVRRGIRGSVLRVEAVDRKGQPTREHYIGTYLKASRENEKPEDVRWEFTYDRDRVVKETAYDLRGNRVWEFVYLPQKGEDERVRTGYYVGPDGYPRPEKEYAGNVVQIEYDADGYERVLRYRSRGLKPARGPDKVFGRRLEYDKGKITKSVSLGPDDQPLNDEYGNAILEVTRIDRMGNSTEEVTRDASGEVAVTTQGWSLRRSAFDSAGNFIEQSYFGPSGEAVHNTEGFHRITWKRDDRGNVVETRYWDSRGSPAPGEGGCFGWMSEFDARDNLIRGTCFGSDGQPAFHAQGYAISTAQYDANRNVVDTRYLDPAGNPALVSALYAGFTYRYDSKFGKVSEVAYYSTDGSPAISNEGIARIVREYDGHGRMRKEAYYGIDGNLTPSDKGYAFAEWRYDAHGNISRIRYFGSDGKPAIGGDDDTTGWKARHDAGGRQIEVIHLDSSDKPMVNNKGIAGFRSEYDEAGNQTQYSHIGLRGEACLRDGVAGWISSFDPLGKELERRYLGPGGEPAPHKEGYARWTAQRDARGNLTELRYYDTRGKSVMVPWQSKDGQPIYPGRARAVYKYNAQSRLTEEAYWGTDGKPASTREGWARATHEYDLFGNKIKTRYYGSGTSPIRIDGGYYSIGWRYNHQRRAVETEYFSRKEEPVSSVDGYARVTWEYDLFGRLVEEKLFDTGRKPTASLSEGFHKKVHRYDPRGQEIETEDYGIDGKPVLNRKSGCHILKFDYDQRKRMVEERCLGKKREPTVNTQRRAASVKFTYDAQGRLDAMVFFEENRTPLGSWQHRYDSYGKPLGKTWVQAVKRMQSGSDLPSDPRED